VKVLKPTVMSVARQHGRMMIYIIREVTSHLLVYPRVGMRIMMKVWREMRSSLVR
jgi:hypothetical protein